MLVIDEYLAVDVTLGDWPAGLPDDEALLLPASRHFRLLRRIHQPSGGQLTTSLARLPEADRHALRNPHPEVLQILDPRPLLDEAAQIGARYSTGGLLVCETLAAGLVHGRQLWFGTARTSAAASPRSPTTSTSPSTLLPEPLPTFSRRTQLPARLRPTCLDGPAPARSATVDAAHGVLALRLARPPVAQRAVTDPREIEGGLQAGDELQDSQPPN